MKSCWLLCFTLAFAAAAATCDDSLERYRRKNPPNPSFVYNISNAVADAVGLGTLKFPEPVNRVQYGNAAANNRNKLGEYVGMSRKFAKNLYEYVDRLLVTYCRRLLGFIGASDDRDRYVARNVADRVKLEEADLCAVQFLFHFETNVDAMFRVSHVVLHRLSEEVTSEYFTNELASFVEHGSARWELDDGAESRGKSDELLDRALEIKKQITAVSSPVCDEFRRRMTMRDSHYQTKIVNNTPDFSKYLFKSERFIVKFSTKHFAEEIIESWNTSCLLDTPEYGIANYMEEIKMTSEDSKTRRALLEKLENDKDGINVQTLRDKLKFPNTYYFDNVKYVNILLEVFLVSSVKEGHKLLGVAKDFLSRMCLDDVIRDTLVVTKHMRAIWSATKGFKLTFDKVLCKIEKIITLEAPLNDLRRRFYGRMDMILKEFKLPDKMQADAVENVCAKRDQMLGQLSDVVDVIFNRNAKAKFFTDYYLSRPLTTLGDLNAVMDELYQKNGL